MGRLGASSAPRNDRRARSDLARRRLRGRAQTERAALPSAARECRPCRFFAPHRKKGSAAIPLLSAIARLDISSPREQGVRFAHGVAMSSQKNGAAILDKTKAYRPSDKEPFMNERQREYFRQKLLTWKEEILKEAKETLAHLQAENENHPDLADRASSETDRAIELRARDRQRKLIAKIDAALARLEDGTYGYCEETGEPISLKRLEARPIATLSVEAQERHERRERIYRDE
jgi:DnaK suppressor protein